MKEILAESTKRKRSKIILVVTLLSMLLLPIFQLEASNISSTSTGGNWGETSTWVGGIVPGSTDNVTIVNGASVTVNSSYSCQSLTLAAGTGSTSVFFNSGTELRVDGTVTINPPIGASTNNGLYVDAGTLSCTSIASSNSTADDRDSKIRIGTGTLNVSGNVMMGNTTARNDITFTDAGTLIVGGNLTTGALVGNSGNILIGGVFTPANFTVGTSTVDFNGSGNQTIPAYNYYNLTISGSRVSNNVTFSTTTGVANNFIPSATFSGGGYIMTGNTFSFNGTEAQIIPAFNYNNLTISGARTTNSVTLDPLGTIGITGTFSPTATFTTGAWINNNSTIDFNGDAAQNIPAFTYYHLSASNVNSSSVNSRTKTLVGNVVVSGNMTINGVTGATVSINSAGFDLSVSGNTFIQSNGSFLDSNNSGTNTFIGIMTIASGGSISTNNNSPFVFRGGITNYGTFTKTGAGDITFNTNHQLIEGNPLTLYGNLNINNDITLTLSSDVNLYGNFINSSNATEAWQQTAGVTTFASNAGQSINSGTGTGSVTFYNLVAAGGNTKTIINPVVISNNLTINNAVTLSLGTTAQTLAIGGNATVDGTLSFGTATAKTINLSDDLIDVSGTINMSGAGLAHVLNLNGANNAMTTLTTTASSGSSVNYISNGDQSVFANIGYQNVATSGSGIKTLQGTSIIGGNTIIDGSTTFLLNGQTLTSSGNVTIQNGATLHVNDNATLQLGSGKSITNNGVLKIVGSSGAPATVTRSGTSGGYTITQTSASAVMQAAYYQLNFLSGGVTLSDGSIDAINNFSNGIFSNGTGSQYLTLTGLDVTGLPNVSNVVFNAGPTANVTRTSGIGAITFENASGVLAGENYDIDNANPGTLILWDYPASVYYSTGNVSAGLTISWTRNADGTGGNPSSVTDGLNTLIIQNGHTVTIDDNGNLDVMKLQVGQGESGSLIIGANTTQQQLTIREAMDVKNGATVTAGSSGSTPHQLLVYGNIYNQGTINLKTTSSNFVNTQLYGIMVIGGNVTPIFNDVTFKAGCNATAQIALDINGNVFVETGATFNDGGLSHNVAGDWSVSGNYAATGTIVLDGLVNTIKDNSTGTSVAFNNLTFSGVVGILSENVIVNGNLLATNNTSVNTGLSVTSYGNFTIESGSTYSQTGSTTTFAGTNAQTITLDGANTFNNVTFSNGGSNVKTIIGNMTVTTTLILNSGATIEGNGTHTITGGVRIDGTCNLSGTVVMKGGNLSTNNASNTLTLGSAALQIDGNVGLSYGGLATALSVNINNNTTIVSGYLVLNSNTQLVGVPTAIFKVDASRLLYVRGSSNFPTGFGTYDIAVNSTVLYDAAINQTIRGGVIYGNLTLGNTSSIKTVDESLDVNGNLNLSVSTLDLQNYVHTLAGNIANSNGSIAGSNATLTLDAENTDQSIAASGAGSYQFYDLNIIQSGASQTRTKTFTTGSNIQIFNNVNISNGGGSLSVLLVVNLNDNGIGGAPKNLILGEYCQLNTTHADFYSAVSNNFTGTKQIDVNSTVNYSLNGDQIIADDFIYGNITFNGGSKTARGALDINGFISRIGNTPVFIDGGFTHTVEGNWNLNSTAYYTPASATGTIVFDGNNQTINGVNFNHVVIANSGTATVSSTNTNVYGNLTINSGGILDISTRNINLGGNFMASGNGQYVQTTGTTTLNGTSEQTVTSNSNTNFGIFTINKPMSSGSQNVRVLSDLNISGTTTLTQDAGVLDISNQTVYFGGSLYLENNSAANFITTGSTAVFNGSDDQNIRNRNSNPLSFNNINLTGSGTKTIYYEATGSTDVLVNGNVNISGSSLNGSNTTMYVRGNWDNNATFAHNNNQIVYFDGANQTISASNFRNVDFRGTDTKTLTGNITVNQNVTLTTATLDANDFNITLSGNWTNSAYFDPGTGKVTFSGSNNVILASGTTTGSQAGKSFYDVEVNKTSSTVTLAGDLDMDNDFTITSGTLTTGIYDMWVGGNFDNYAIFNHSNNTSSILTLNATGGTKNFRPNGAALRGVVIDAATTTYVVQSDFSINNVDVEIKAGELKLNKHNLTVNGTGRKIIINGGTLNVDEESTVSFTAATQGVNMNSGALKLIGTEINPSLLTGIAAFSVNQLGGTIHANQYKVHNGQISIAGGNVDVSNNFSNGTFSGNVALASYLTLTGLTFTDFSVDNLVLNSGATNNIVRTSGSGTITVQDASGAKAGQAFESDNGTPGTLIEWTYPDGFFWDNDSGDNNWHNPLNWSGNALPGINDIVYINHDYVASAFNININSDHAVAQRVMMDTQGGNAIALTLSNSQNLTIKEHLSIGSNNATLTQADASSVIYVGKNWTNIGAYNHGNSTVVFNGNGGDYTIYTGGTGVGKNFYNLTIEAPDANYNLGNATTVEHDLNILNGQLSSAAAANTLSVTGNWYIDADNGGTFAPSTATVTFNGANQSITNGTFYNLNFIGSDTKSILSNIKASNDLTIGAGITLLSDQYNVFVSRNWINNGGTLSQSGLGTVIFDGTAAQVIDNGTAVTTFNHLDFRNAGTKTLAKNITVNGNVMINTGSGTLNVNTWQLTGNGTANTLSNYGTLQVQGANNFPAGFETVDMGATSVVNYLANINQSIYSTTYGHIRVGRLNAGNATTKTAFGDLVVMGNIYLNDSETILDMATNDADITLSGTVSVPAGSNITWGTNQSTMLHVGGDWYISANLSGFNHLILAGTGDKYTQGNLLLTGNLTVKSNVDLMMYTNTGNTTPRTLTSNGVGSFILESGARVLNARPATDGPAIAEGFAAYQFDPASTYFLYSPVGVNQTLYTGKSIQYGNLYYRFGKTVTSDGVADLKVAGDLDIDVASYVDNGKNIEVTGSNIYLTGYVPSSSAVTLTLNREGAQYIRDDVDNSLNMGTVVYAGSGLKTIGEWNDVCIVNGNLTIGNNVKVTTAINTTFNGSNWMNNGIYTQTGGTLTFNSPTDQTIQSGVANAANYFYNVAFSNASNKTLITNGADFNGTLTINAGTVDLGNLSHTIYGNVINNTGGTLLSSNANITLDGAAQNINTPAFAVKNIVLANGGAKRMFSNWTINGDVNINSGVTLNTSDAVIPTYYNLLVKGNWINNGTFTGNTSTVTFEGSSSPIHIQSGGSNFYNVIFANGNTRYLLQSVTTRFSRSMTIGTDAELSLNGKTLILGSNIASGKVFSINGTLSVNEGALLKFNNQSSQSIVNVSGRLNVVGTDATNIASITREIAGVTGSETQINVLAGGTMAARYYLIEYLQDAGMNLLPGSILDAANNFSDGAFQNIRNAANVRYLNLESDYSGGVISNVTFNYSGTPVQGTHFNVVRESASTPITFDVVGGSLGSYKFENDQEATPSATSGLLRWPQITETNWTGTVNNDWHEAGNWDNGVPTSILDAIIPDRVNYPIVMNGDANCKKLTITTGKLIIDNNRNLTTAGDVEVGTGTSIGLLSVNTSGSVITVGGAWTRGANSLFLHGNGTVVFNSSVGTVNISPRTSKFNHVIFNNAASTFYLAGASIGFDGNVEMREGDVVPSTTTYVYDIKGNYIITNGSFNATSSSNGTINLNGTADQTITNGSFNHMNVAGSGIKYFNGNVVVAGATTISSTLQANTGCAIDFNGIMSINASGTFGDGNSTHTFAGTSWTSSGAYTGNGTIIFDNTTAAQSLWGGSFYNLVINCQSQMFNLENNINIGNNLTVKSGINYGDFKINTFTNTSGTGTFVLEAGERIDIKGANNFPKGFGTYSLDATSITNYYGTMDQVVDGVSYGSLNLNNANIKILGGNAIAKGSLTFNNSTLDVSTNNYSLTVGGNWSNALGNFLCRNGEVIFNGTTNQTIVFGATNINNFYNLSVANTGNYVSANNATTNDFVIHNNLNVTNGQFHANGRIINVGGNMVASANGSFFNNTGTFYLNKPSGIANIGVNGSTLLNLTINSNATYTALDNIALNGDFNLMSGVFNGNGKDISLGNSDTDVSNISGTYKVGAGGTLGLGYYSTLTVTPTGRIEVIGSSSAVATVTNNNSGGRYSFVVEGTIAAKYYLFEYMSTGGIYLTSASIIDATNNLSEGTFTNGTATGPLLRIENSQSFVAPNYIANVIFPINAGGSAVNVAKTVTSSGVLEFYNATGVFSGENYDNDPSNLINWTGPVKLTWNGSVSSTWNNVNNWTANYGPSMVPTGEEDVIIAAAVNQPILITYGQKTKNLTVNNGASIIINTPADASEVDLDVNGDMVINGSLITMSANDYITVAGNWTKAVSATTTLNGNVTFDGLGGARVINNRGVAFHSLTISGTGQYQLGYYTIVNNNLTINNGATFDVTTSNHALTVKGNWNNNGTFNARSGKVTFAGTSASLQINGGSSAFNDIDINASSTYQLTGTMSVKRALYIIGGSINMNGQTINMGDGSGVDDLTIAGTLLINGGAVLNMGNNARVNVNNGGTLSMLGTSTSNRATVTSSSAGRYLFKVNSGANLLAQYYQIAYTDASGLNIQSGATLNATYNLSDGLFTNGFPTGTYLTLANEMTDEVYVNNVIFNAGATYNVIRTSGTSVFFFIDATGNLGTYQYEYDMELPDATSGLIHWTIVQLYTWLGNTDEWTLASNWYNSVLPTSTSNVMIPGSTPYNPVIHSGTLVEVNDVSIKSDAKLTLAAGGMLKVNGNITNNGILDLQHTTDTPSSFINEGNITGNTTVTHMLEGGRAWYLGCPMTSGASVFSSATPLNTGGTRSALEYNTTTKTWTALVTSTSMKGFSVNLGTGGPFTVTQSGLLHTGTQQIGLVTGGDAWNLLANPYPAYVDLTTVSSDWDLENYIQPSVYVRGKLTPASVYSFMTYNLLTGVGSLGFENGLIAPMQAFWVKATAAGPAMIFPEARKHPATIQNLKSAVLKSDDVLRLRMSNAKATDEAVMVFRNIGSQTYSNIDSEKKMESAPGVLPQFYSVKDGKKVVINVLPEDPTVCSIPLALTVGAAGIVGEMTLSASNITSFMPDVEVYLKDLDTQAEVNLRENPTYTFDLKEVATDLTRFELYFKKSATVVDPGTGTDINTGYEADQIKITAYALKDKAVVNISDAAFEGDVIIDVYDGKGVLYDSQLSSEKRTEVGLPNNTQVVIVKVTYKDQVKSFKLVRLAGI